MRRCTGSWHLLVVLVCHSHAQTLGSSPIQQQNSALSFPLNGTTISTQVVSYQNGTNYSTSLRCDTTPGTGVQACRTSSSWSDPGAAQCYFRLFRFYITALATNPRGSPAISSMWLSVQGQDQRDLLTLAILEDGTPSGIPVTFNKSLLVTNGMPLDLFYSTPIQPDTLCFVLPYQPDPGTTLAVYGGSTNDPRTAAFTLLYPRSYFPPINGDLGRRCVALSNLSCYPTGLPANWQLRNGVAAPCIVQGTCLGDSTFAHGGSCGPYDAGPLCNQCANTQRDPVPTNGTRLRFWEPCRACVPLTTWRLPVFATCFSLAIVIVLALQFVAAPPSELSEDGGGNEILLEMVALVRTVLEHHTLCATSWEACGIALAWPRVIRYVPFVVQNSWIGLITLDCIYPNFLPSAGPVVAICSAPIGCVGMFALIFLIAIMQMRFQKRESEDRPTSPVSLESIVVQDVPPWAPNYPGASSPSALQQPPHGSPFAAGLAGAAAMGFLLQPLFIPAAMVGLDCVTLPGGDRVLRADFGQSCPNLGIAAAAAVILGLGLPALVLKLLLVHLRHGHPLACGSEFNFFLSGLRPRFWWFSVWKMLLKGVLPFFFTLVPWNGASLMGPVAGSRGGLGCLILFGLGLGVLHRWLMPFTGTSELLLGHLEDVSWFAFAAAPTATLMIGTTIDSVSYQGVSSVTERPREATSWIEWILLWVAFLAYAWVPLYGLHVLIRSLWRRFSGRHKVLMVPVEIRERVKVVLPKDQAQRERVAWAMGRLLEKGLLALSEGSVTGLSGAVAPGAALEAAMIAYLQSGGAGLDAEGGWGEIPADCPEQALELLQTRRTASGKGAAILHALHKLEVGAQACQVANEVARGMVKVHHALADVEGHEIKDEGQGPAALENQITTVALLLALLVEGGNQEVEFVLGDGELSALAERLGAVTGAPPGAISIAWREATPPKVGSAKRLAVVAALRGPATGRGVALLHTAEDQLAKTLGKLEARRQWCQDVVEAMNAAGSSEVTQVRFPRGSRPRIIAAPHGAEELAVRAVEEMAADLRPTMPQKFLESLWPNDPNGSAVPLIGRLLGKSAEDADDVPGWEAESNLPSWNSMPGYKLSEERGGGQLPRGAQTSKQGAFTE